MYIYLHFIILTCFDKYLIIILHINKNIMFSCGKLINDSYRLTETKIK